MIKAVCQQRRHSCWCELCQPHACTHINHLQCTQTYSTHGGTAFNQQDLGEFESHN
jgi:hypothetical protein